MGGLLSHPSIDTYPEEGRVGKLRFAADAMQGWRMSMEDAHLMVVEEEYGLFGVFDGHGGREAAIFVASHLPAVFARERTRLLGSGVALDEAATRSLLDRTFRQTDQLMREEEGQRELAVFQADAARDAGINTGEDVGCTGVLVLLDLLQKKIFCANAGDSRAVLCRGGETDALSDDHKPTNAGELARVTRNGGYVTDEGRVCGNLNLSRAFADFAYKDDSRVEEEHLISVVPDIEVRELQADDEFIVLGCDGIWELQTNEEVIENVKATLPQLGSRFEDIPVRQEDMSKEDMIRQEIVAQAMGQAPQPQTQTPPHRMPPHHALGGHTVTHHGLEWQVLEEDPEPLSAVTVDSSGEGQTEAETAAQRAAGVRRNFMLSDCCANILRYSLAPSTTTGLGCDNMTTMIVDLREWAAEASS